MTDCVKEITLKKEQRKALDNLNIATLNDMQRRAVEFCRLGQGMVLLSPTGSGKTVAYLLPLLERMSHTKEGIQAVIVVPSRELAGQVCGVWRAMKTAYNVVALYGGRPLEQEIATLSGAAPALIVGTPGRLTDHLKRKSFSPDACSLLVMDEFDKCLEMGFCEEMQNLVELLPAVRERFLLSATDAEDIPLFAGGSSVEKLDFRVSNELPKQRTLFYKLTTTPEKRLPDLLRLLCSFNGEPAMVFCNFRESVEEVRDFLVKNSLRLAAYHGAMEQKERELALYRFSSSCVNILVCTDLAARGLDIKNVRNVVHYQRPLSSEIFTHRNGRTARWDSDGAVYVMAFEEKPLPDFVPENIFEFTLPRNIVTPSAAEWVALYIGKGKRDKISRGDIAGFLMKKGGLRADELGSITVFDRYSYAAVRMKKKRAVLKNVAGEKIKGMRTIIEPLRG